jgi:hypothetical protein
MAVLVCCPLLSCAKIVDDGTRAKVEGALTGAATGAIEELARLDAETRTPEGILTVTP